MDTDAKTSLQYDQVVVDIGLEWLAQYARFLRQSPELIEDLAAQGSDFELVPIPRVLLERLAVPGLVGTGSLGEDEEIRRFMEFDMTRYERSASARQSQDAFAAIRQFAAALGAGGAAAVRAMSPPSAPDLGATLDELLRAGAGRQLGVVAIEATHASDSAFAARVTGEWSGSRGSGSPDAPPDPLSLEVRLERDTGGGWTVRELRIG